MKKLPTMLFAFSLALGCDGGELGDATNDGPETEEDEGEDTEPTVPEPTEMSGMVFTLTNDADGNAVSAFARAGDGSLEELGNFPTGGLGTGSGLGSQAPMALSEDGAYLYVVNPGSNDISSFQIFDDHLSLISITDSGGTRPVSLALRGNRLYTVNADDSTVQGYAVEDGWLIEIAGAHQPLSTTEAPTGPAQIGLHPRGDVLIVTEKATNLITTYQVDLDGSLSEPMTTDSEGETPFGFDFDAEDSLVVSEAFGGDEGASTASSYKVNGNGSLTVLSSAVPSGQSAACWVTVIGGIAYTTNTASNNISSYEIDGDSNLALVARDDGVAASLGEGRRPIDMATAGGYLYVLNAGTNNILGFSASGEGSLAQLDDDLVAPTSVGLLAL